MGADTLALARGIRRPAQSATTVPDVPCRLTDLSALKKICIDRLLGLFVYKLAGAQRLHVIAGEAAPDVSNLCEASMRVWLVVDYEALPGIDGSCRYLRYGTLANALACNGHDVTWWTSDFDHIEKRHRHGPWQIRIQPNLMLRMLPGVGYDKNISLKRIRHNRELATSFTAATRFMPADSRPDVVMVCLHALELAEAVAKYTASRSIPLIVDVVDIWPDVYLRAFPPAFRCVARHCLHPEYLRAKRVLQSAQAVTAVSHTYLDWASSLCQEAHSTPGAVFPLGYDASTIDAAAVRFESARLRTEYCIEPSAFNLAFVGQLSHSYDLQTVVEAARLLYPSFGLHVRFFIAGDGIDRSRLQAAAHAVPTVACTGWLSHPAVTALLENCSTGLASYARGATQSLPYKPFEYMAAGLALLSCLPGELAELISREGIGVQYIAGSPESLTNCIRSLVDNPERCALMGRRARDVFEAQYRADRIYGRLADHLERVASAVMQ